jgi:hypothetical protein
MTPPGNRITPTAMPRPYSEHHPRPRRAATRHEASGDSRPGPRMGRGVRTTASTVRARVTAQFGIVLSDPLRNDQWPHRASSSATSTRRSAGPDPTQRQRARTSHAQPCGASAPVAREWRPRAVDPAQRRPRRGLACRLAQGRGSRSSGARAGTPDADAIAACHEGAGGRPGAIPQGRSPVGDPPPPKRRSMAASFRARNTARA